MHATETAATILDLLLPFRRIPHDEQKPGDFVTRPSDFPQTLHAITSIVEVGEPLTFVLPGFPCKSPNPAKVLGTLPDAGERTSLRFLDQLCAQVAEVYPAGARLVVCSDGHIFADAIGVDQDTIDRYFEQLRIIAAQEQLGRLDFFSLRDRYPGQMDQDSRQAIIDEFGPSLEQLRTEVRADPALTSLYRGIVRFLVEDSVGHSGSRSALQRECRRRAYHVLQRSIAWGEIVNERFPDAVRLSIHPHPAHSEKFGLRLLQTSSIWTTPWHAAPLQRADGSMSLVRHDSIPAGARLHFRDGRPDHYRI